MTSEVIIKINGYPLTCNEVARMLGRKGGQVVTEAKSAAARRNGKLGGRPRRTACLNEALLAQAGEDPAKWEEVLKELDLDMRKGSGGLVYGKDRNEGYKEVQP